MDAANANDADAGAGAGADAAALVRFLKRYSPIPNQFIDDMFGMYARDTLQTDAVVDLDMVAKWLGVPKANLMRTLVRSYAAGVDYVVTKVRNPRVKGKYGGNSYKRVLLTPDCFKRVCMRSQGKRGEDVRTYCIEGSSRRGSSQT